MNRRPLSPTRLSAREIAPLIVAVYARPHGLAGCCLHVICDDGNIEDGFVQEAEVDGTHPECVAALAALKEASTTQRQKAIAIAFESHPFTNQ